MHQLTLPTHVSALDETSASWASPAPDLGQGVRLQQRVEAMASLAVSNVWQKKIQRRKEPWLLWLGPLEVGTLGSMIQVEAYAYCT
jgi:hypothetical protein